MMLSNYTFLTDHSYSLQPVSDDNDDLPLNQREGKNKKYRRSSNRMNETISTTNRTVSIDRSSSDKENSSLILSNSNNTPIQVPSTSINTNTRSYKKTSNRSRRNRLSTRTLITNSRSQSGKKQDNKTSSKTTIKSTQNNIDKKKKRIDQGKTKSLNISQMDSIDVTPSLSIEERVKLRRTKPLQSSTIIVEKIEPKKINKSRIQTIKTSLKKSKKIPSTKTSSIISTNKNKKLFLGSGLDLDNIVLGNRQRRCIQT
ncbi:unnamed protein product [Rotaria sordida]|uniref:Uncharacterized protein n=1 Tax=Rotaria sordida TaxID=392033 RepID=A0A818HLU4_9BILA|nr:unnamed protein product [Rotaria sordida]CAF0821882.1 unnamed protein product [Rotaria sordida]CAF3510695.1 unnamed protein product [Rotaria sordida]CAF3705847.1 unnamed protein product [Rotaria sordida]